MKVVIIGGVAGGASCAARIRRLDEKAQILIFERSGYISYANCGLPYYIGGVITDRKALTLQTPESFWSRFRIQVKTRHEVTSIDTANKTVTVKDLSTNTSFTESYDRLVIATGAKPTVPAMAGTDLDNVFTVRTVEDTLRLRQYIEEKSTKSVVIAGGGFVGIEMAENLRDLGANVTIVQKDSQLLTPLDPDMATFVHAKMRSRSVNLKFNSTVMGFESDGDQIKTLLAGESPLVSDIVILAIGVTPDTKLAKDAGLKLGIRDSIVVNDLMQTSAPDIYAVGDAVQVKHYVTGEDALISLAGPANKQGRIAANNICGKGDRFPGSQGSSVLKLFDLTIASTGINEKTAKAAGIEIEKVVLPVSSHATYYPDAQNLVVKVICSKKTQKVLGAQITGYDTVDKRIDVLATAIHCGMTGPELAELDLAYAPPYASAKDPVNMAGFVLENLFNGLVKQFHYDEVPNLPTDGSVFLVDVRTPAEYEAGHADGFVNIPLDDVHDRMAEIPADRPVYVMCRGGTRSYIACRILEQNGYDCYNFSGGYSFYSAVSQEIAFTKESFPCCIEQPKA